VNVGTIEGGSGITAIAAFAEASFEGRSLEMDALDAFIRIAERIRDEIPLPSTLAELGQRPGGVLDADHALVLRAQQARERVGLSPAPTGSSSSDANPFIAAGIPALTLGITTGRNAHQLNEEIDIAPIGRGAAVLATLVDLLRIA
jgi:acetylornithine deacetylase/succinyl-diaminopimelate desuccinylase-like protein